MLLVPRSEESTHKLIALVTTLATMAVGVLLLVEFNYDNAAEMQFQRNDSWISVINARYEIGIDGISLPLLILSMVITLLVVIYSWNHFPEPHNPKAFLILMLVLEVGMN